jgi:hypothetical protein
MSSSGNVVNIFGSEDDEQLSVPEYHANPENLSQGYIHVYRSLKHCSFYEDVDKRICWLHMLLECTHKPYKTQIGRRSITLQPGQLITSYKQLAEKVPLLVKGKPSVKKARNIVEFFESEGMISREESRSGTVFTLLKFEAYQGANRPENKGKHGANKKGKPETDNKPSEIKPLSDSDSDTRADTGQTKRAAKQENNSKQELPKGNSCQEQIPDAPQDDFKHRPDAAIQTPNGKRWGTSDDLANARHMSDTVARLQGAEKSALSDKDLIGWANDCRLLRGMKTSSGKSIESKHIQVLWDFAHQQAFWNKNMQSPGALRRQWEKLATEYHMARTQKKTSTTRPEPQTHQQKVSGSFEHVDYGETNTENLGWMD